MTGTGEADPTQETGRRKEDHHMEETNRLGIMTIKGTITIKRTMTIKGTMDIETTDIKTEMDTKIGTIGTRKTGMKEEAGIHHAKAVEVSAFLVPNAGHLIYSATLVLRWVIFLACANQCQNQIIETRTFSPFEKTI